MLRADDLQVEIGLRADEGEGDRVRRRGGPVFDREHERVLAPAEGERRIDPGKKISGSAQAQAPSGTAVFGAWCTAIRATAYIRCRPRK